jgi:hypothetical protein
MVCINGECFDRWNEDAGVQARTYDGVEEGEGVTSVTQFHDQVRKIKTMLFIAVN